MPASDIAPTNSRHVKAVADDIRNNERFGLQRRTSQLVTPQPTSVIMEAANKYGYRNGRWAPMLCWYSDKVGVGGCRPQYNVTIGPLPSIEMGDTEKRTQ